MLEDPDFVLPPSLVRTIEDAVLFGHVQELDAVLNILEIDGDFPEDLRSSLEALRYFRSHYGKAGLLEPENPKQKQKVSSIESSYAAELLDRLKRFETDELVKSA